MQVLKFGGSSVANKERQDHVLAIVKKSLADHERTIIVLSAMGGVTDMLLKAAALAKAQDEDYLQILESVTDKHIHLIKEAIPIQHQSSLLTKIKNLCNEVEDICKGVYLVKELSRHTSDSVVSYGEILSTIIFSEILRNNQIENVWCDSRKFIKTNNHFGDASVDLKYSARLLREFIDNNSSPCFVFPGFIGSDDSGNITTLGRGGSDYTAAIIGMAVQAREIQIWTDVSGMMTADPNLVKHAKPIRNISYQEALELSHFGAKVIYPRTIAPAMSAGIPILVKNSFAPEEEGTRIDEGNKDNKNPIRGISSMKNTCLLTLEGSGMIGIPGISKRLFEALAREEINVILITQSSSEYGICVAVDQSVCHRAKEVIDAAFVIEIETGKINPIKTEEGLSIIAIVGDKMNGRTGMSGMMFSALGRNNINVRAIAQGSSERNISAVIKEEDVSKALNLLHEQFFENTYKQINLFICGTGNVGRRLIGQLLSQHQYLKEKLRLQVRIKGLANSRNMVFFNERLRTEDWEKDLGEGEPMNLDNFIGRIVTDNLRNSIFVDVTASDDVAKCYGRFLEKSISVIACNKIACSSDYEYYHNLKQTAAHHNSSFLFETNVGAGLPVIETLNDLMQSGDELVKIEAVLSGSLNFIFNNYNGDRPFADVVKQALDEGYTEPDPRLDLSGVDVMRKILILAREAGGELELADVANQPFLPEACMAGDVDDFFDCLRKHETYFKELVKTAHDKQNKLKFIARLINGKAVTGLSEVDSKSDFYNLYGKDNIVLFYTRRYTDQPLVIKGAGAGADVTASGVFADILRASR